MHKKLHIRLIPILVIVLVITVFILSFNLHNTTSELTATREKLNNALSYPVATSQPPILLKITYIQPSGKELSMQVYDNSIDVGNKTINEKLTEFFLLYREHNLLCSNGSTAVRITEEKDVAHVIVSLPETSRFFDIHL